jgi:hypothetical protein
MRSTVASIVLVFLFSLPTLACAASAREEVELDSAALAQLEQRAQHAEARDQAYLYTELVQIYTQMAGKQMAAGDMDQATVTLKRVQHYAALVHAGVARDAKKLKNAEMIMQAATFRLGQCMRMVSSDDKPTVESTLHQLDKVHDELLAQVFSH